MARYELQSMISIHTPREGSDRSELLLLGSFASFQSTLPARGATRSSRAKEAMVRISIHTPREGSDVDNISLHNVN